MVPTLTRAIQPHGAANPTRTGPGEELPPGNNPSAPGEGGTPREPGKRGGWSPDLRCLLPAPHHTVPPGPLPASVLPPCPTSLVLHPTCAAGSHLCLGFTGVRYRPLPESPPTPLPGVPCPPRVPRPPRDPACTPAPPPAPSSESPPRALPACPRVSPPRVSPLPARRRNCGIAAHRKWRGGAAEGGGRRAGRGGMGAGGGGRRTS